jgi:hypothetical protein
MKASANGTNTRTSITHRLPRPTLIFDGARSGCDLGPLIAKRPQRIHYSPSQVVCRIEFRWTATVGGRKFRNHHISCHRNRSNHSDVYIEWARSNCTNGEHILRRETEENWPLSWRPGVSLFSCCCAPASKAFRPKTPNQLLQTKTADIFGNWETDSDPVKGVNERRFYFVSFSPGL